MQKELNKQIRINVMTSNKQPESAAPNSSASSMFQGYNNVTDQALNTIIEGNLLVNSGMSELQYVVTKSLQQTYSALNISSSVSAGYGGFSGEAKVNFVNQLNLTKESLCIIVKASDKQNVTRTNNVNLKSGIKVPKNDKEVKEFIKKYGDSYISSLVTGAEYYAVYAFICETSEQRTTLEAQLSASGISLFGGSLSADFQMKLEKVCKASLSRVTFQQIVSGLKDPHLPSQDNIINYALSFFDQEINNPAIISYETTSYDHVPDFPPNVLDQVQKNVSYFTDPTGEFTKKVIDINELINQCENLESIYKYYDFTDDQKVNLVFESAQKDLQKLKSQQDEFNNSPISKFVLPELPSLNNGKPVLQFNFKDSDSYGGPGGSVFNDINQNSYFQKWTRLINVRLYAGKYVDRIVSTFECSDPVQRTFTNVHGGSGGEASFDLQLTLGVWVNSISGRYGKYVDKLEFGATNGQKISGGGNGGSPFSCKIPEGYFVAGFRGRAGKYLDQFGVVYAKLLPAIWKK